MNENKYLGQKNEMMGENSFMKKLLKKRLNQKGLTLIELLAVIVILAIVAAIAIPAIGGIIENSRIKAVKSDAVMILNAAKLWDTDNDSNVTTTATAANPIPANYLESAGEIASYTLIEDANGNIAINATVTATGYSVVFTDATIDIIDAEDADDDGAAAPAAGVDVTN